MRIKLDLSNVADEEAFHDIVAAKLEFPAYYGRNLDALWDCLTDLAADHPGIEFSLSGLGRFRRDHPKWANHALDCFVDLESKWGAKVFLCDQTWTEEPPGS